METPPVPAAPPWAYEMAWTIIDALPSEALDLHQRCWLAAVIRRGLLSAYGRGGLDAVGRLAGLTTAQLPDRPPAPATPPGPP